MISSKMKWLIWVSKVGSEPQAKNQSIFIFSHNTTHENVDLH